MVQADWLKIDEICRLWGQETGRDPLVLQEDLENWFAEFTKESTIAAQLSPDAPFDTIVANRLMGMLGARYLERRTFERYCEERCLSKPRFWLAAPDAGPGPATLAGARRGRRAEPPARAPRRRGSGRGRAALAAGLAVVLVALLAWGTESVLRRAGDEPIPQASGTAEAPPEPASAGAGHVIQLGDGQETDPDSGERATADAQAEAERLRADNAQLMDQLAQARASVESLRAARQQVGETSEAAARDRELAGAASLARLAALEAELVAARRQIEDLNQALEEAGRRPETTVEQPPEAPRTFARTDPAGGQVDEGRAEGSGYGAEIAEVLTGVELPSDPGPTRTVASFDVVPADDLLLHPDQFADRQVVVTGSVVWLLRRYWLRSDSGQESILIDIDGLQPNVRSDLEDAVANIETLARVRARITARVEARGSDSYRLAASEVVLLE